MTGLRLVCVNPLDHAGGIKELFLADGQPQYPEFFDRAYVSAVRTGGKSWIGLDAEGCVVMHIARFTRRFVFGERILVGGVLLDLRAAKSHRTFFPPLTLLRQLIADSKGERDVDFLYGIPNARGNALFNAAGFSTTATLGRFVFPLGDRRWYANVAARAYQTMVRIRAWNVDAARVEHAAQHFDATPFERPARTGPGLRPFRSPELFLQCLAGYPGSMDHWLTFQRGSRAAQPCAAAFVRGGADGVATLFSLSREPSVPLSAITPALAAALRRAGYHRLSVSTLIRTDFAKELTRAGFVQRADRVPMMVYPVTELGAEALRSMEAWEITALDCDPYIP
jgi:hypothetical protein